MENEKVYSVYVDGFEMNSYYLTLVDAEKMKADLELEDEYLDSDIDIEKSR